MSDENLFSEFDEDEAKTIETNVKPSEVLANQDNPYEGLNEDQKIILNEMASGYSLNVNEVILEFNKAYSDKSLNMFDSDRSKKFNLAKAIMKSVLDEKAKVKSYKIMPIGKNVFYAKSAQMVISTTVAFVSYEHNGKMVKKKKAIKSFDDIGKKTYKGLQKMNVFYTYDTMLKRNEKNEFTLSEFSQFEHGNPPEGKIANLTDLEIYRELKIIPKESIKEAGMSRIPKNEKYADPTDLKAIFVLSSPANTYKPPTDFPDVISISAQAIDFEGNSFIMNFPSLPEFVTMINEFPKGERFSGIAIGTLSEDKKTGQIRMNVYNFYPSEEEGDY